MEGRVRVYTSWLHCRRSSGIVQANFVKSCPLAFAVGWHGQVKLWPAPRRPMLFVSGYSDDWLDVSNLAPHEAVLPKSFPRASLLDATHRLLA